MLAPLTLPPAPYRTEESFMKAFQEGVANASGYVYEQMHEPLGAYIEKRLWSTIEVDDIRATVFLKLCLNQKKLTSLEHIRRWLYVAVNNQISDLLERKKKQKVVLRDVNYLDAFPDYQLDDQQTQLDNRIVREVSKLPDQKRTIIHKYYYEKQDTLQIADALKLSPQTVLNHKAKAISTLRQRSKSSIATCFPVH